MNKSTSFVLGALLIGNFSFAQKKTETDAALEFKRLETAFGSMDMEGAKKSTLKAIGFIDAAASHPETEKSPKTLFYKGEIYAVASILSLTGDEKFNSQLPANTIDESLKAYNNVYTNSDKYDAEVKNSLDQCRNMLAMQANELYKAEKYKEAGVIYESAAKFGSGLGTVDTEVYYNAAICAEYSEQWEKAATLYKMCADNNYKTEKTVLNCATAFIKAGKTEEAGTFLQNAVSKDPKNATIYWVIGTLAMDKNDDEAVKTNLQKAIELKPDYADAYYNLGTYFQTKGQDLRSKASELDPKEKAKIEEMKVKSVEFYTLALPPLEKYAELDPKNAEVLKCLWTMSRTLKFADKEAKYKAAYEAAK